MTLDVKKPADGAGLTIEAWAQGYMVGSLIIMACLAVANMRRHVLLHKLIVVEVRYSSRVQQTAIRDAESHITSDIAALRNSTRHFHLHEYVTFE